MPIIESAFKKIKTLTESLDPGLVVVTKKQTVQDIETLIHEGQYHFGENYLQAALPKIHALAHYPCQWHFIGQVQTNKLKLICEHFHWIQSISQQKQIARIGQLSLSTPINICIQVRSSSHSHQSGIAINELNELLDAAKACTQVRLRGLMYLADPEQAVVTQFEKIAMLFHHYQPLYHLDTLSMGMSQDYQEALACGATMIRIGRNLFR